VVFPGVEAANVEAVAALSPEVQVALPALVDAVVASVEGVVP
jgi:hypothetical protein